jgi:hypothetical protein
VGADASCACVTHRAMHHARAYSMRHPIHMRMIMPWGVSDGVVVRLTHLGHTAVFSVRGGRECADVVGRKQRVVRDGERAAAPRVAEQLRPKRR